MFEVNGVYANRRGEYTVLELNPPMMRVRFTADGSVADLKISLQERIWENISVEYEAKAASKSARKKAATGTKHYIKVVTIGEDLTFPGRAERVIMNSENDNIVLNQSDRIIIYALESKTFIAVATITGDPKTANPKDYFYTVPWETANFYPIDIDAEVANIENGVDVDSNELESQPRFKRLRLESESFLLLEEDDFELLAEALAELSEEEEEEIDDDDEIEPDDED